LRGVSIHQREVKRAMSATVRNRSCARQPWRIPSGSSLQITRRPPRIPSNKKKIGVTAPIQRSQMRSWKKSAMLRIMMRVEVPKATRRCECSYRIPPTQSCHGKVNMFCP
jgi:hypothetical protein